MDDSILLAFSTSDGKDWLLDKNKLEAYEALFKNSGVDVWIECNLAKAWSDEHPKRLKTYSGMNRFLLGWLKRSKEYKNSNDSRRIEERKRKAGEAGSEAGRYEHRQSEED